MSPAAVPVSFLHILLEFPKTGMNGSKMNVQIIYKKCSGGSGMEYLLHNQKLTVNIDSLGGEMKGILSSKGSEFLWNGNPDFWDGHSPNLFPFVGRLTEGRYTFEGCEYHMGIHGFLMSQQMTGDESSKTRLVLSLRENQQTLAEYPFVFTFRIIYELKDDTLSISYEVSNTGNKPLYFGLGGHPGFHVPLESGLRFEDFYLEFDSVENVQAVVLTEDCFVTEERVPFPLQNGKILKLKHSLFDNDAIVLTKMSTAVTLKSSRSHRRIRVEYPQMPYLGLWHMPRTSAPYLCIEPWLSLPSEAGTVTDLETEPDLIKLLSGKTYTNTWSITCRE